MKIKVFLLSIIFLIAGNAFSQEKQIQKANEKFNDLAYIDAITVYERVANKGYKSAELFQKLGDAYYFNAELEKASKWYNELFLMDNTTIASEYYYRYSQSLKSIGEYEKANQMLEKFNALTNADSRGNLFSKKKDYLEVIRNNSGRYKIKEAGINSEYSDFGTAFLGNKIIFASTRDTSGFIKREHKWTNEAFTDLFVSEIKPDSTMTVPVKFSNKINTKFNESTPIFTKDGKTVYFTRNNFSDKKRGKDKNQTTLLKIYKAVLKDSIWTDVTELSFNSNEYNTAHPALSTDEKLLYFASDMPGTLGQSDIFKVAINNDGTFGTPENLGPRINTEGKETFPFLSAKNELYFASDGHPGLGGLDIFVSKINQNQSLEEPINVGQPVNSSTDDFAFVINTENKIGFFSSYRKEGKGFDDIYTFYETKKLTVEQILSGTITDEETGETLANVDVLLLNDRFEVISNKKTDENGLYSFDVEYGKTYYIRSSKEDFETTETKVVIAGAGENQLAIKQKRNIKVIVLKDDIAKTLNINKIYFDLDKSFIRDDAKVELAKVLEVMLQYPTLKIDVRSHTDSRQTHKYNMKLSERRAKATVEWLVQNGIAPDRLSGKGYGETELINKCADGVQCTEEEHQLNRRSEFIVIGI